MKIKNSQVRSVLYGLRTQWGQKITLKTQTVTVNLDTGLRATEDVVVKVIRQAIVLPEVLDSYIINLIGSVLQANKGKIDAGTRLVIIDGCQLRGETVEIGMLAEIGGITMEVSSLPMDILSGQGYLLVFRRKA